MELVWRDVDSSNLSAVAYDGTDLHVRFTTGGAGRYLGVPQAVFDALLEAPSKGVFLNKYVKAQYAWVKGK